VKSFLIAISFLATFNTAKAATTVFVCENTPQQSALGTQCVTSAGVVFVRINGGWQDTSVNGKIWFDRTAGRDLNPQIDWWNFSLSQKAAEIFCQGHGGKLPSSREFLFAEGHGFREILKDTMVGVGNLKQAKHTAQSQWGVFGGKFQKGYLLEAKSGVMRRFRTTTADANQPDDFHYFFLGYDGDAYDLGHAFYPAASIFALCVNR
jgi:hypothetical protein